MIDHLKHLFKMASVTVQLGFVTTIIERCFPRWIVARLSRRGSLSQNGYGNSFFTMKKIYISKFILLLKASFGTLLLRLIY